jgi:hypothetical protein
MCSLGILKPCSLEDYNYFLTLILMLSQFFLNPVKTMVLFGFYLELAKSKGSTKTGVFWINV